MSDTALYPTPALGGYRADKDGIVVEELTRLAVVSIATPLDGDKALDAAMQKSFGTTPPAPGKVTISKDGKTRFLGMAPGQIFAVFNHDRPDAEKRLAETLSGSAYTTDQTDVWVALRVGGESVVAVLERICPLDLHPDAFPADRCARTVMEHMAAIVLRDGEDGFVLLTARSSARSFLHAVEVSVENVL
ncbi:Sarcosine oxidase, gamma subunit family [Methyloligella halotolerans]|uniref:Sarcosine oxidase, gamma subunit family n=1 Tax=Methyloligella halotolerans TaxID=1177755 RepID=A0A1E2S086_9HYPH|nr:sarcosine oxidase subunit gamma family protein [Methyloligella halotolerans]ODA67748.1 Sarcosine oxidase, gamma subunit family [Methyloligella halotolerans]